MTLNEAMDAALKRIGPTGVGPDGEICYCEICNTIREIRATFEEHGYVPSAEEADPAA